MNCPGEDVDSYAICLECRACQPEQSSRVQELLETVFDVRGWGSLVEAVKA